MSEIARKWLAGVGVTAADSLDEQLQGQVRFVLESSFWTF